jgi:hypothetical protein
MQTQIGTMQDLNSQDYLRTIADHMVLDAGAPADWGSTGGLPASFGLCAASAQGVYELDADKVSRLNSQNAQAVTYLEALQAAKLDNLAFGVSISPMLQINTTLAGTQAEGDATAYTFMIEVAQDAGPVDADLHCYAVASGFVADASNGTSDGVGWVTVELPNSASGPAELVVFARASFDSQLAAVAVHPFGHLSAEPQANLTFTNLSPLNHTLTVIPKAPSTTVSGVYAFTYSYQANLTAASAGTYAVPVFADKSPVVLVVQGSDGAVRFNEWTAYPQVPLDFGADLSHSEANVFVYSVNIDGVLYKLTLRFGGVPH